jgi:hypothetical protein
MIKKAQVTLEFTTIFVIIIALLFGLLSLWKWSSDNIVRRQCQYNETRVQAGSNTPGEPSGRDMFEARELTDKDTFMFR